MKKSNTIKILVIGMLILVFAFIGIQIVLSGRETQQHAGKNSQSDIYAERFEISDYKSAVPKALDEAHKDWIFAGWYKDESCDIQTAVEVKPEKGELWAKFVPREVLCVKYQVTEHTDETSNETNLRIISTIDSLSYNEVGFFIEYDGMENFEYSTKKVFRGDNSNYFFTITITDIPHSAFDTSIYITPYVKTLDGTYVNGTSRYVRVEDTYLDVVNVPVHLYPDTVGTSGSIVMNYDADNFEFVGIDGSNAFKTELSIDTSIAGKVICSINETPKADELFGNFRFQLKDGVGPLYEDSLDMFTISVDETWNVTYTVYTNMEAVTEIVLEEAGITWTHGDDTGLTGGNTFGVVSFDDGILKITDCFAYAVHKMKFLDSEETYTSGQKLYMQIKATPNTAGMNNLELRFYNHETTGSLSDGMIPYVSTEIEAQGEWVAVEMELDVFLNAENKFEGLSVATFGYNDYQSGEMYSIEIRNIEIL